MSQPRSESPGSHEFQFTATAIMALGAPTLGAFVALVAVLHLLNGLDWLPAPARVEGTEQSLIRERAKMTRSNHSAEVLIIGDSSSAIAVNAPLLSSLLPGRPRVLNQGMFMALGLDDFGEAARRFIEFNPGQVKLVVMVVTTDKLRSPSPNEYFQSLWREVASGIEIRPAAESTERLLAIDTTRDRVSHRILPWVSFGRIGRFYGGDYHLRIQFAKNDGTMREDGWHTPPARKQTPAWIISQPVMQEAAALKEIIPDDIVFAVGIAPVPESFVGKDYRIERDHLLHQLGERLQPDLLLTNIPPRFPDGFCSSVIHLNPRGAEHFTRLLAAELSKLNIWSSGETSE